MRNITPFMLFVLLLIAGEASAQLRWLDGDVEAALARSGETGKRVLVYVTASWCPACQNLKREVLDAPTHAPLLETFERVTVDFDKESSRRWVRDLVILGLPTAVVLDSRGQPVGRIRGYEGASPWTTALAHLRSASDLRLDLEAAAQTDATSLATQLDLARVRLERGDAAAALTALQGLAEAGHPETSPEALFIMGRYHHRVMRDPESARPLWRRLALGFPKSPFASGAWWWYARSEAETGHPSIGMLALMDAARERPEDPRAARRAVSFAQRHPALFSALKPALYDLVTRSLERTPDAKERADLQETLDMLAPPAP